MSSDAKQCPWCQRWCLKDDACNYIFACGLTKDRFILGSGCGNSWCWQCGKKFCGPYYNPITGAKAPTAKEQHDANCCKGDNAAYCCGGHNSHCDKRWD